MKKLLFIISLLFIANLLLLGLGSTLYAGIEEIQIKVASIKSATRYYGSDITRYDLGDTECFTIGVSHKSISCLRK